MANVTDPRILECIDFLKHNSSNSAVPVHLADFKIDVEEITLEATGPTTTDRELTLTDLLH